MKKPDGRVVRFFDFAERVLRVPLLVFVVVWFGFAAFLVAVVFKKTLFALQFLQVVLWCTAAAVLWGITLCWDFYRNKVEGGLWSVQALARRFSRNDDTEKLEKRIKNLLHAGRVVVWVAPWVVVPLLILKSCSHD